MSDIIFSCPKCSKSLAIDEGHTGAMVKCVDCSFPLRVPVPAVWFQCKSCKTDFAAPRSVMGKVFQCCNCRADITIPSQEKAKVPADVPKPEPDPVETGVKLSSLDEADRKRMINNMFTRHDIFKAKLKKASEPKIIKYTKRVIQYAVICVVLWLLSWLIFNRDIATVVLTSSAAVCIGILVIEAVLFRGIYE